MGIKEYYEEDYNILLEIDEQSGFGSQKLFKDIIGDPENLRILDVGVGTGSKIEWLTERNDVYGLEINESAILKSKERGIKVIKADIEKKFPFDDKFFDLVICSQVLEHLVQPQNTMQEINRVLKTEGIFVVDVPNHFGLLSRLHIMWGGTCIGITEVTGKIENFSNGIVHTLGSTCIMVLDIFLRLIDLRFWKIFRTRFICIGLYLWYLYFLRNLGCIGYLKSSILLGYFLHPTFLNAEKQGI